MANVNNVRKIRESKMMSKAELARKASVTVQTIDRIEKGNDCRLDTKRKIILALGYKLGERSKVFAETPLADIRGAAQGKSTSKSKVKVRRQTGKGRKQA
ncbi:helix-turn-helix transcriptional regulator [Nitrospina watsonii]|uniref:Helix-turn-helix motif protein n=1 Tax=Nitrospina watsonii TaxID=1323948 RepID=A0ABM9HHB3_9BACT|nr:helix-turn-helix transcriptional regulator [Nitrospina watsonii]CAI2719548.1 Putative helix-turn-helix motif protein [Nitrospina watsonii]